MILAALTVAVCAVGWLVIGCGDDDPVSPPTGDTTPPTVVSTNPLSGYTDVSVATVVRITFSEPIDSLSVDSYSITISGSPIGDFGFSGSTVTFTPLADLSYDTEYSVTATVDVTDMAGNGLTQPYGFTFTTEVDPNTLPPTVVSSVPASGAVGVAVDGQISATFSKGIDVDSFDANTFTISGVTGSWTYENKTVTFWPAAPLDYNAYYTATVTATAADTFGIHMASDYSWSFTTEADPLIPVVEFGWPFEGAIIGDTVTMAFTVSHPVGVDSVRYFVNGWHQSTAAAAPFEYLWDASGSELGSEHMLYAAAYDSTGRIGYSDTMTVHYRWEELATDPNDDFDNWPRDVARVLARSDDSILEFRYEFHGNWENPLIDTMLDLAIWLDTDRSRFTGRNTFGSDPLNDIGGDYRIIMGGHMDTSLAAYTQSGTWGFLFGPSGFQRLVLPLDTNFFEIGLKWTDIGNPESLNLVSIAVHWIPPESILPDWTPDQNQGHLTVRQADRFIGERLNVTAAPAGKAARPRHDAARQNPFD